VCARDLGHIGWKTSYLAFGARSPGDVERDVRLPGVRCNSTSPASDFRVRIAFFQLSKLTSQTEFRLREKFSVGERWAIALPMCIIPVQLIRYCCPGRASVRGERGSAKYQISNRHVWPTCGQGRNRKLVGSTQDSPYGVTQLTPVSELSSSEGTSAGV
jgi:hypothetical protein